MLTQQTLRELLFYDSATGVFTWRKYRSRGIKAGDVAGRVMHSGKRSIRVLGRQYFAHRLAWLYMTGSWPAKEIDHKDRDGLNNRWENLREATSSQNNANKSLYSNNSTGLKGVQLYKYDGRFKASIRVDGKHKHLGIFATAEEAHAAYIAAAKEYFGEFANY